jgi:hypothetical protein
MRTIPSQSNDYNERFKVKGLGDVASLDLKTMLILSYLDNIALIVKVGKDDFSYGSVCASMLGTISLINLVYPQLDKDSDLTIKKALLEIKDKLERKLSDNRISLDREDKASIIRLCINAQELISIKFKAFGIKIERKISASL